MCGLNQKIEEMTEDRGPLWFTPLASKPMAGHE